MDDLRGAFFSGTDQVLVRSAARILDVSLLVLVVGEDLRC